MAFPLIPLAISLAAEFAPTLIKHLAGDKAGDVAERVVAAAQTLTGAAPDAVQEALRASPEIALQFKTKMADVEVEIEKAYLADRQDARMNSTERSKISESIAASDARRKIAMSIGDVVGLIACSVVLVYVPDLPGEVRGIISTIAGFFGLGLRDAHQFEFGSSRGSETKTVMLNAK